MRNSHEIPTDQIVPRYAEPVSDIPGLCAGDTVRAPVELLFFSVPGARYQTGYVFTCRTVVLVLPGYPGAVPG